MKKFSKLTNQPIVSQPVTDNRVNDKVNEKLRVKYDIINLIDNLLKIQSYGSVDNRFLSGSVKIEGKDMLAEALIDYINNITNSEKKKVLESLKGKIGDWALLDSEIQSIKADSTDSSNRVKFQKILEKYTDEGLFTFYIKSKIPKIKSKKTLLDYKVLINESNISKSNKNKLIRLIDNSIKD